MGLSLVPLKIHHAEWLNHVKYIEAGDVEVRREAASSAESSRERSKVAVCKEVHFHKLHQSPLETTKSIRGVRLTSFFDHSKCTDHGVTGTLFREFATLIALDK
ncbi:hypothetical protein TNCV_2942451 [Trichonephila clavipes]|nr:hypothetical protein TNCV_2942451 [Trichonephila clavipes]